MSTSLQFGVYKDGILWNAQGVGKFKSSPADGVTDCYTLIKDSAARHSSHPAVSERPVLERRTVEGMEKLRLGPYRSTTFSEYIKRVDAFGSGLQRLANLSPKDTVVIYADTQQSWMQCAFGCWRQGLCVGTIYSTLGDEGALFGLNQSEAKVVIADGKLLKVLGHIASKLISVKYVITLSDDGHASEGAEKCRAAGLTVAHLADLEASGVRGGLEPESLASSSDTAVLMYTSGTTGNPKGVMITHGNVCAMVAGTLSPTGPIGESYLGPGKSHLAYLPLAHIMELTVEISTLFCGGHVGYGSPGTVLATSPKMLQTSPPQEGDAEAFKPTLFLAAPVVLDKVVAGVRAKFRALPWLLRCFVDMGLENGAANWERGGCGATNPLYSIFFRKKVAKALGGQVKFIGTGSAPLSAEVQKFVATIFACPVRQGYGLTETTAITCITHHTDNSTRCVGPPTECACIRLRDWEEGGYLLSDANNPDIGMPRGEILVSGPTVCAGYYESHAIPDADVAQKNITDFVEIDGMRFFCTGDVGQILLNGNLAIIDRKKDLVKLQQGEYVALSKVENALKDSKYVALPMVYADPHKSFCIALVCPQEPALQALARELHISTNSSLTDLCNNEAIKAEVLNDIQASCKKLRLARFEIPQRLLLIDDPWTPENGMLTAIQKLKRKPIYNKHKDQIEATYNQMEPKIRHARQKVLCEPTFEAEYASAGVVSLHKAIP